MNIRMFLSRWLAATFGVVLLLSILGQSLQARQVFAAAAPVPRTGSLNPIPEQRIYDTRTMHIPFKANTSREVKVLGNFGIPAYGVSAVVLNFTAVHPNSGDYITAYAAGTVRPISSILNYAGRNLVSNTALVQVGTTGTIAVFSSGDTDLVIEAEAWIGTTPVGAGAAVTSIAPTRVLDSRTKLGGRNNTPLTTRTPAGVQVTGQAGIPAGVSAVFASITAWTPKNAGYVTAYGTNMLTPATSSVNLQSTPTANFALIPVGADGKLLLYSSVDQTNIIVDVQGYVSAGTATIKNAGTQIITPTRVFDSRNNVNGQAGRLVAANETIHLKLAGMTGIPADGVAGVIVHITTSGAATNGGSVTIKPDGSIGYLNTIFNLDGRHNTANTVVTPLGPSGALAITNKAGPTDLIVDVQGWVAAPDQSVTAPVVAAYDTTPLTAADSKNAKKVLDSANKYAMTTWWNNEGHNLAGLKLSNTVSPTISDAERRLGMESFSMAVALTTGAYDPAYTGVSTAEATARTIAMIDHLAAEHTSNNYDGWGAGWQGSLWSTYGARAAWLLWKQLPAATQTRVAKMVVYEADATAGFAPHYLRDASGAFLGSAGDTGSDDTSWWGMPFQIAAAMMPNHPHAAIWRADAISFGLAAWARPSDANSNLVINGAPLSAWIDGSNVEQNGIVYNHNRVAPDYMSLMYQTFDQVWVDSFAGRATPQAVRAFQKPVYSAYTAINFVAGNYTVPGGTIYTPGKATIYYPQGIDWGNGQMLPYALADAQSAAFGTGNSTSAQNESLHVAAELALQARGSDGRTYQSGSEYLYAGREEHSAQLAAQLYMTKYIRDHNLMRFSNDSYWLPRN